MDLNLKKARSEHFKSLEPLATGRRINHLRDDPSKISEFFRIQNNIQRQEQYMLNINSAKTRLNITDAVLVNTTDMMNEVYELALQGNDENLTSTQITSITNRITDLYDDILDAANTKLGDNYLFSGFLSSTQPFATNPGAPPPIAFSGDTNDIDIQVSATRNVQVSLNGDYLFTGDAAGASATVDVFAEIQDLITNITAQNSANIAGNITDIQSIITQFTDGRASLGNSMQQLDSAESMLNVLELANTERMSALVETDIAKATSELSLKEFAMETAFAVSRRIMDLSLSSFLT
ncbi:flagellar hook-associated protein 3 [bacterium K02(2017)]|nr:flagellar hook-associated protein 3 [bacterium K02(2017)]